MILLDTNALLWLHQDHPRSKGLDRHLGRLYISPANLFELQLLTEAGRLRLRSGARLPDLSQDGRWLLDDPPAAAWFERALDIGWTRDPFDRLLVAHAEMRGWRLATGDRLILERSGAGRCVEL